MSIFWVEVVVFFPFLLSFLSLSLSPPPLRSFLFSRLRQKKCGSLFLQNQTGSGSTRVRIFFLSLQICILCILIYLKCLFTYQRTCVASPGCQVRPGAPPGIFTACRNSTRICANFIDFLTQLMRRNLRNCVKSG